MKKEDIGLITKSTRSHRVDRPSQTGCSSPTTHYSEPRIDLNEVLVENSDATFFIRISDHSFHAMGADEGDVLVVDKSIDPKNNQLALAISDGEFNLIRLNDSATKHIEIWGVVTYIIKSQMK